MPSSGFAARHLRARAAVGAALTAMVAAGCGGGHDTAAPATSAATTPPTASTSASPSTSASDPTTVAPSVAGPVVSPLTGLPPSSPSQLRAPAVVVKIDNVAGAFPQTGVGQADVVYEEMVEGGLTRLAAVYQSEYPAQVGPVRSGRLTDIALADDLNHPVLAFAGANGLFLPKLRAQPLQDVDIDNRSDLFVREGPLAAPHDLYTSPAQDAAVDSPSAPPAPLFAYRAASTPMVGPGSSAATSVAVSWPAATASWQYDPATHLYSRVMNGVPDVDSTGRQLTAANVVVQPIGYVTAATGYEDGVYTILPEGQLLGSGPVYVLSGGRFLQGTWRRSSLTAPTTYTDGAGQTIALAPGATWVELTNAGALPLIK